jgi:hypothetical protein
LKTSSTFPPTPSTTSNVITTAISVPEPIIPIRNHRVTCSPATLCIDYIIYCGASPIHTAGKQYFSPISLFNSRSPPMDCRCYNTCSQTTILTVSYWVRVLVDVPVKEADITSK